ncbi:MAG: hypothetical protein R6W68_11725 [Ignavibacteriaceae bacterium]
MNLIKTFRILLVSSFLIILTVSCAINKKDNDKVWNLVMKEGLLYKDSLATEPFTGHYEGKVMGKKIEFDVVDGKKNGIFVIYNQNGNVETIGYIENEKNYGEWKYYYPNGVLESVGKFREDKPDSVWNWYYMTGTVKQTGEFSGGKKHGEWKYYDDFGNHYLTMKYKNDELKDSISYELPVVQEESIVDTLYKESN